MKFDQQKKASIIQSTADLFKKLDIKANTLTSDQKNF